MELSTIRKSIELLLNQTTNKTEQTKLRNSITELDEQKARSNELKLDSEPVCIVSVNTITNLLNCLTYNDYGKFYKTNGSCSFEQYSEIVRNKYDLDITDSSLETGYYLIRDLYRDNEYFGHNNPDGTIKI